MAVEHHRHRLEHGVPRRVAVAVVDRLEAVEIEVEERRARSVALHIGERALELALEAAPVEYIGEWIDVGARFERRQLAARRRQLALEPLDLGGQAHRGRTRRPRWRLDALDRRRQAALAGRRTRTRGSGARFRSPGLTFRHPSLANHRAPK